MCNIQELEVFCYGRLYDRADRAEGAHFFSLSEFLLCSPAMTIWVRSAGWIMWFNTTHCSCWWHYMTQEWSTCCSDLFLARSFSLDASLRGALFLFGHASFASLILGAMTCNPEVPRKSAANHLSTANSIPWQSICWCIDECREDYISQELSLFGSETIKWQCLTQEYHVNSLHSDSRSIMLLLNNQSTVHYAVYLGK